MNSLNTTGKIAGALMLIITVLAPFSMLYIPSALVVSTDATATANRIMASEGLFRLAIVSDAVVFLIEIALVALLYALLKPVSKTLSLAAAFARLAMTVVQGINLINYSFVLLLLGGGFLAVFEPDQLHALMLLFLKAHEAVVLIWGLFFGLHLLLLGYLVYKSGYIPRIMGVLLELASLAYLTQSFGTILLPQYEELFATIGFLSIIELAFPLWLLITGIRDPQPAVTALQAA